MSNVIEFPRQPPMPIEPEDETYLAIEGEFNALWNYWKRCDVGEQIIARLKIEGVERLIGALEDGVSLAEASRIASTHKNYSPSKLRRAYLDVIPYDRDIWEPIVIRSRHVIRRPPDRFDPAAWEFIVSALRHPCSPTPNSVIQRAVALGVEHLWAVPPNAAILALLKDYERRVAALEPASILKFPPTR